MSWQIEQRNGLYLPELDWYLDARKPVARSFVSHAHFDHMGKHEEILCSPPTAKLIQARLPGKRNWRIQEFGQTFELAPGINACLYPAGHIIGSSMLWLEKEGQSLLYTGDFKLTPGSSAETCQPVPADTLIVETTYGLPRYTFPPESEVFADMIRFCRETLENGDTPVLFGYSLGKSQSILKALTDAQLEVMLHPTALKLTQTCRNLGWTFPPHLPFDDRNHPGKVVISPPFQKAAPFLQRIKNPKTAIISGWAIDPSSTYRYQTDKAFPLSDHADYLDLQNFVAQVQPKTVYTVHGFAREFAATLREQGYQAWALGRENQLNFPIAEQAPLLQTAVTTPNPPPTSQTPATHFEALARTHLQIAATDSLQKKLDILQAYLAPLDPNDVSTALTLLLSPSKKLLAELTPNLVRQSLLLATGTSESEYKKQYQLSRDTAKTIYQLLSLNPVAPTKTLREINSFLKTLAVAPNPIFKQSLLSEQFRKLSPNEGLFLQQFLANTLSNGLSPELLCQAIATRFDKDLEKTQAAYLRSDDLTTVSLAASSDTLDAIRINWFHPIAPMNARSETSAAAIIETHGLSLWAEQEHAGLRCQIHKNGEHVDLYDTNRQRITHLFPEFIDEARQIPQHFICDAVVVPWGYEEPLPRSELEKRLSRKAEDLFLGEEVPVVLWLFDILALAGIDLLDLPLEQRRQKLDTLSVTPKIRITPVLPLMGIDQIENAYAHAISTGNNGLVFKKPDSLYNPLSNFPLWLQLNPQED